MGWRGSDHKRAGVRVDTSTRRRRRGGGGAHARAWLWRAPAQPCWLPPPPHQHTFLLGGSVRAPGPTSVLAWPGGGPTRGRARVARPHGHQLVPSALQRDPSRTCPGAPPLSEGGEDPPRPVWLLRVRGGGVDPAQPPLRGARVGARRSGVVASSSARPPTGQVIG